MLYAEQTFESIPSELFRVYPKLKQTLSLIKIGHDGQTYNLLPYWHHPVRVMLRLNWKEVEESDIYAALLHDTLEDTCITEGDLRNFGYGENTIRIVKLLTRNPDEQTYKEYVQSLIATKSLSAMRLKLCDLYENSNNVRFLPPEKRGVMVRYGKSIADILEAMTGSAFGIRSTENLISGELDKAEVEKWIGEQPAFL